MALRAARELISSTFNEWMEGEVSKFAASLAFYTLFSIGPILMILLAAIGALYGEQVARAGILERSEWLVGVRGVQIISTILQDAHASPGAATLVGVIGLLFAATAVFVNLQDALNSIWGVAPKPGWRIWPFIRKRLLSFLMILVVGSILLLSFLFSAAVAALREYAGTALSTSAQTLAVADFLLWFAVLTLCFAVTYKVLPDVYIRWHDVWIGAAVAALLFTIGRTFIGIYLARSAVASAFGAAGSLVLFLVWIYYSAQIFLLCSEFTQVYAKRRGTEIVPDENAVRVVKSYV